MPQKNQLQREWDERCGNVYELACVSEWNNGCDNVYDCVGKVCQSLNAVASKCIKSVSGCL